MSTCMFAKCLPYNRSLEKPNYGKFLGLGINVHFIIVHIVFGSRMRPCEPCALDLTIANTWVRF